MKLASLTAACIVLVVATHQKCHAADSDGSWITFLSHRSGNNLLYKMRPDGSEVTSIFGGELKDVPGLSKGRTSYREPHWTRQSPDGRYFLSWAADLVTPFEKYQSPYHFMIHLGRLDGGQTRIIAPVADEEFAWSPDSKQFAYAINSRTHRTVPEVAGICTTTQIVVVGVDGSNERVVLEQPGYWHVTDWSPDGKKLLLIYSPANSLRYGSNDLIEFNLEAAEAAKGRMPPGTFSPSLLRMDQFLTTLTGGQPHSFYDGRYSPDGRKIATTISRHLEKPGSPFDPNGFELAILDLATASLRSIAKYPEGLRGPLCWSSDGMKILFSRYLAHDDHREKMQGGLGIWSISPDGKDARFITTGWSPDWSRPMGQ